MKKVWFACLLVALVGCGGSGSEKEGGGGGDGAGVIGNACGTNTVTDFFVALHGTGNFVAVDTFAENELLATEDDTFVDGKTYSVDISTYQSVTIPTENGTKVFTFDAEKADTFESDDQWVKVMMTRDGVWLIIFQPCIGATDKPFIRYNISPGSSGPEFAWRLDLDS